VDKELVDLVARAGARLLERSKQRHSAKEGQETDDRQDRGQWLGSAQHEDGRQ